MKFSDYFLTNKNRLVKTYKGGGKSSFIFGDLHCWFSYENGEISSVLISLLSEEEQKFISKKPKILKLDNEFLYLKPLVDEWAELITNIVSKDNKYYNLTHGIEKTNKKIPPELLNFYKIYHFEYSAVTCTFCFDINGAVYDVLGFDDIKDEWENVSDYVDKSLTPFAHNYEGDFCSMQKMAKSSNT